MTGDAPDEHAATTVETPEETASAADGASTSPPEADSPTAADPQPTGGEIGADLGEGQQPYADAAAPAAEAPPAAVIDADDPAVDDAPDTPGDGERTQQDTGHAVAGSPPGETQRPDAVPDLASALEAVLMVVDEPIPVVQLAQVLEVPRVEVEQTLQRLATEYTEAGRGFDLRAVAGGWRFYSRPECAPIVERFILDGQRARLTQAALETLAVVAYRQPVSRARVSAIRGVNCDGVVRTLVNRGLIEEAGTEQDSNAVLYRTTNYFLERLGLQNLGELPDIAPYLPDVDELDDTEDAAG